VLIIHDLSKLRNYAIVISLYQANLDDTQKRY